MVVLPLQKNITVVFEICGLEDVDVSFDLMSLSRLVDFELNDSLSVWPRRLEYGEGLRLRLRLFFSDLFAFSLSL